MRNGYAHLDLTAPAIGRSRVVDVPLPRQGVGAP